jgi:DNA adenine methylase
VAVSEVTRPVLRWHGGKWKLTPAIISFFPKHRVYVEAFAGAASILLRKPPVHGEVFNDLDDWVVTLFRVLRDKAHAERLIELLRLTPFARTEFEEGRLLGECVGDPIELCRRLIIRSYMGFGSNAHNGRSTGFRSNSNKSGTLPAHNWANYPDALRAVTERLRGVTIENRDASEVMRQHDSSATLHYVDPPYLAETRSPANKYDLKYRMYRHELTRAGHIHLLAALKKLAGMVVLSGYPSDLYDARLKGWARHELPAYADGARARTEVLWLNPACAAALEHERAGRGTPLFPYPEAAAAP